MEPRNNCWPTVEPEPSFDQARRNRISAARELQQLVSVEPVAAGTPIQLAWAARGSMNVVTPSLVHGRAGDLETTRRGIARAIAHLIALDQALTTQARS